MMLQHDAINVITQLVTASIRLSTVINNAANTQYAPFMDTTPDDWSRVLTVNLTAPFIISQHAARIMCQNKVLHFVLFSAHS